MDSGRSQSAPLRKFPATEREAGWEEIRNRDCFCSWIKAKRSIQFPTFFFTIRFRFFYRLVDSTLASLGFWFLKESQTWVYWLFK
ncbi:hypothetical protein L6452_13349 [Arctium lappa]|uniref:Uncharacterized protein n=1 Tax=Arctium lappa TaxID=4217 RepID=A0ACB9CHX0_ARCLA|nr:hypothetical protein L6452_13349 [Arctium lappa]